MKKTTLLILCFLLALQVANASFRVLETKQEEIIIEYNLGEYSFANQNDFVYLVTSNMNYSMEPGAPMLAYEETKIAIPPSGSIQVTLLSSRHHSVKLEKRIMPVPEVVMEQDVSSYQYTLNEQLYQLSKSNNPLLNLLNPTTYRGIGFCPLEIHPFSYDGNYNLEITDQAIIKIEILGNTSFRSILESDDLTDLFLSQIINPEQAKNWQYITPAKVEYAEFSRSDYWWKIETDREGIFKIAPSQLTGFPLSDIDPRSFRLFSNSGVLLPFAINSPGNAFQEIPIQVIGEEDGRFDAQDYILFYGTTRDGVEKNQILQSNKDTYYNPYSGNCVYWLTFGGEFNTDPLRIATLPELQTWNTQTSTFVDNVRLETEKLRRETIGFDWYMTLLAGKVTADYDFTIELPDLSTNDNGILSFSLRQESVNYIATHNISVYVNGNVIPSSANSYIFSWQGLNEYVFQKSVPYFVPGVNTIRIRVHRDKTDNIFLDWINVKYTRNIVKYAGKQTIVNQLENEYVVPVRYNVSSSTNFTVYQINSFNEASLVPVKNIAGSYYYIASGNTATKFILTNEEYYLPAKVQFIEPVDLVSNPGQVDNIIITPDEFINQAQTLADKYNLYFNKRSKVVRQSDIFNQFNSGHPDPEAIRLFLSYVFQNYPTPRITSVTLLGLGTIDWRNFSSQAQSKNKMIVYQRDNSTSDDFFVMLTQTYNPELAIGRYPVTNLNEINIMFSNFSSYVENPVGGWWKNSMVFVADDLYNGSEPYYENYHTQQTETLSNTIHPSILIDKIFGWEYEYDEFQNKPKARDDMMAAINEGRLVWLYVGHGGHDQLGAEDYFNGATDMGRFNNPGKLTFFIAASCEVSKFDYWGYESLGQKTVLLNNLGAIASLGATRMSAAGSNVGLTTFILDYLANKRNPLGYSIMAAKTAYTQSTINDALYVLLGDPLLHIVPPVRDSILTIFDPDNYQTKENQGILYARQKVRFTGSFSPSTSNGIAEVKVFNNKLVYNLDPQTIISHRGAPLFVGSSTVNTGFYQSGFIVPDDVTTGNSGLIVSYFWDPNLKQSYTNYYYPLQLSDEAVSANNPDAPHIEIYLDSMDFRPGDIVGTDPILYARISDSNGINVTGSAGHNILLILDNSLQPVSVTNYFRYDTDSFTQGILTYPLSGLSEGVHSLQIIAFDNFNLPAVTTTHFQVRKVAELYIERFLIYPNPMKSTTNFTFILPRDCELTIDIYTISGKKIYSMKTMGRQGFNSIPWDGRDNKGDKLANNTYFVKIRAKDGKEKAEKIEKLVIYH